MRHPFDGLTIPNLETTADQAAGHPSASAGAMARREWLSRLLAAAAGVAIAPVAADAGQRPPRPQPSRPPVPSPDDPVMTTQALGEEGNPPAPRGTPRPPASRVPTTLAVGEEGTPPRPPRGVPPRPAPFPPGMTTQALGEEGNPPVTTFALGEEGNPPFATTFALGEEGNPPPPVTTFALGEEG